MIVNCDYCEKPTYKKPSMLKKRKHLFCSVSCSGKWQSENNVGENNCHWKGGSWLSKSSGYIHCSTRGGADIPEHRRIVETVLGRPLGKSEIVHHINGDKIDNKNDNLLVCTKSYHHWLHNRMASLYMREHFSRRLEEESSLNNPLNSGKPKLNTEHGNPEPSLSNQEGVETRQGTPHKGEGIVQTTNEQSVAKAIVGMDPRGAYIGNT